jgi:hypothetical protein
MSTPVLPDTVPEPALTRAALRTPRAAAVAGIVFGVLLIVALVLIRLALPGKPSEPDPWVSDSARRHSVVLALGLVPFAGIAFLWFIGVVRDRIGQAEDRFFATVFLGSGLLFVGMLFVSAAIGAGALAIVGDNRSDPKMLEVWTFSRQVMDTVARTYAMRMAAVFVISTSTLLWRTGSVPRWLALSGYLVAAVLLFTVGLLAWVELVFPAWVLLLSTYVLIVGSSRDPVAPSSALQSFGG